MHASECLLNLAEWRIQFILRVDVCIRQRQNGKKLRHQILTVDDTVSRVANAPPRLSPHTVTVLASPAVRWFMMADSPACGLLSVRSSFPYKVARNV